MSLPMSGSPALATVDAQLAISELFLAASLVWQFLHQSLDTGWSVPFLGYRFDGIG